MEDKEKEKKSENNKTLQNNKKKNTIMVISLCIVGFLSIGLGIYFLFSKDSDVDNNLNNNNESNLPQEDNVYKSDDGKVIVKIQDDKSGNYNNDLVNLYKLKEDDKYISFTASSNDFNGQCEEYYFLINKDTQKIEKYNDGYYEFSKVNDGYYFFVTSCGVIDGMYDVYSDKWNLLGVMDYNKPDDNGYVYAVNNKVIAKYDVNGNEIKNSEIIKDYGRSILYDNSLYSVIRGTDNKIYLLDFDTNQKYELLKSNNIDINAMTSLIVKNNVIEITLYGDDLISFTYNPATKKVIENKENKIPEDAIKYTSGDGKEVYLKEIGNTSTKVEYELYIEDKIIKLSGYNWQKNDNKFVASNDYNWYLFDRNNKKILGYSESKNAIDYDRVPSFEINLNWYIIYDDEKIVQIVNDVNGTILSFNKNYPDKYYAYDKGICLKFGNKIIKYDVIGNQIESKTYDKIILFAANSDINLMIYKNDYYYISWNDDAEEIKYEKVETYKNDSKELEIYSKKSLNSYLLVYDNEYYVADSIDNNYSQNNNNGYEYDNIYVDKITGGGQYYYGTFLVNKKTKELLSLNVNKYTEIFKTTNGYYFVSRSFEEGDPPYELPSIAKKVTTSTGKTLNGTGMYTVTGDNLTIEYNNKLIKYDISGNIVDSLECDEIYLIDNGYAFIKISDKYYVVDIANNSNRKEVEFISSINPDGIYIYSVNNEEILFMKQPSEGFVEYEIAYKYNFDTNELETTIND